jgi:chromosome segregation ATPase
MSEKRTISEKVIIGELQARLAFTEERCLKLAAAVTEIDEDLTIARKAIEVARNESSEARNRIADLDRELHEAQIRLAEIEAPTLGAKKHNRTPNEGTQ